MNLITGSIGALNYLLHSVNNTIWNKNKVRYMATSIMCGWAGKVRPKTAEIKESKVWPTNT